jgi:hypothetical protein
VSSHDHIPNTAELQAIWSDAGDSPMTERTNAVYLAVLLIGQRTPEELATLADYLLTGTISEWRNG